MINENSKPKILYIDDEDFNLKLFYLNFNSKYEIFTASSGEDGLKIAELNPDIKVVITDSKMPQMSGLDFLINLKKLNDCMIRIVLTAYMDIDAITESINRVKVFGYIYKPYNPEDLINIIDNAVDYFNTKEYNKILINDLTKKNYELRLKKEELENEIEQRKLIEERLKQSLREVEKLKSQLVDENTYLLEEIKEEYNLDKIITRSPSFKKTLKLIRQVSFTNSTVLIQGETGTGKELLARAIHNLSQRAFKPLIKVNCASLPENLIESELFGHEKGAFTGALMQKKGKFEVADKSTIFLDEIGELPLTLQPKLLRVLQEGEFDRLGGNSTIHVDVRIIAATNRNLQKMVQEGTFRQDLFYRLNVFPINSIPLRDRPEDIIPLAEFFIENFSGKIGKKINSMDEKAVELLRTYNWPGNIRELENAIERAVIVANSTRLDADSFSLFSNWTEDNSDQSPGALEKKIIREALRAANWKIQGSDGAANKLNIAPSTLRDKIKKYGLEKETCF